jgi:hypothetical protein
MEIFYSEQSAFVAYFFFFSFFFFVFFLTRISNLCIQKLSPFRQIFHSKLENGVCMNGNLSNKCQIRRGSMTVLRTDGVFCLHYMSPEGITVYAVQYMQSVSS